MGKKVIQSLDNDLKGYGDIKGEYDDLSSQLADIANVADYIDVRNYGVKTDGSDCTLALQNAINAAIAKQVPIKFPTGSFGIYSTIHINNQNIRFIGTFGQPYSGQGVNSTTLLYYGTGSMFEFGLDDGIAYDDSSDYNGVQGAIFEHIRLLAGTQTGTLTNGNPYMPNTTAIKDWRGGSFVLKDVHISHFDTGFWAVKSDYNLFENVYVAACKTGIHLDARCDQNTFIHLSTANNDRAIEINRSSLTRFVGCQFVVDGATTINPIKIYSTYASSGATGTLFEGCWFEDYSGQVLESFVEIGVGDSIPSTDITFRDCFVGTNPQLTSHYVKYFVKIGQGRRINIENPVNGNLNNLKKLVYCVGSYSPEVFVKMHADYIANLYETDGVSTPNVVLHSYGSAQVTFQAPLGRFAIRNAIPTSLTDYRFTTEHGNKTFAIDFYNTGDGNTTRFQVNNRFIQGTAAPTTKTWDVGDYVQNTSPSVQGTAGSQYIIRGWACTVAGTPGTWVQDRGYTGT